MRIIEVRGKSDLLSRSLADKHHYYEIMAKNPYSFVSDVAQKYWKIVRQHQYRVGSGLDEINIGVYIPNDGNIDASAPVLAFNGTDWSMASDIRTDLNKVSPGLDKFIRHEKKITEIIKSLAERYGKVIVTGYSLGGCYAQYTALRNWKYILKIITFQSPPVNNYFESLLLYEYGFNLTTAQVKKVKDATYHYLVEGDPVPGLSSNWSSSGKYIPGHVLKFKFYGIESYNPADAHEKNIFDKFIHHNCRNNKFRLFPIRRHLHMASRAIEYIDYESSTLGGLEGPNIARINRMVTNRSDQFRQAIIDARANPRVNVPTNVLTVLFTLGRITFFALFYLTSLDYFVIYLWDQYTLRILRNEDSISIYMGFGVRILEINPTSMLDNEQKLYLKNNFQILFDEVNPNVGNFDYIDIDGYLTARGLLLLRNEDPRGTAGLQDQVIRNIFKGIKDPNADYDSWLVDNKAKMLQRKRSRWQERLIKKEIIDYFQLVEFTDHNNNTVPNVYKPRLSTHKEKVYLTTGIAISTILSRLLQIFTHYRDNYDSSFNAYVAGSINFPAIPGDTDDADLLDVTKYRYLYIKMRSGNLIHYDENLTKAYYTAHSYYLDGLKTDPLGLLPDDVRQCLHTDDEQYLRRRPRTSRQVEINYTMNDFRRDALGASRKHHAMPKTHVMQKVGSWYSFLFAGFRRLEDSRNGGWIAEAFLRTGTPDSALYQEIDGGRLETLKILSLSFPDLIIIRPSIRTIEVIDPTFRFEEPYHNFKTAFYVSIMRQYLPGWTVSGLDHRDARNQTLI